MTDTERVTILIAEDDDGHAELIREHLQEAGLHNPMRRFHDGRDLLDFLLPRREELLPYLLLLDIRMPRLDGIDVLKKLKSDKRLRTIPVMMLTTTDDPREIDQCYQLGCNCYITKPIEFKCFTETLKRLGLFIQIIRLP
ncbi:MAG: hypothetical protein C0621_06145 [Desulfuromonas sp.]|nr:MAG: hypothetical protein C0621_06145 [Desulfuromonas sp.]